MKCVFCQNNIKNYHSDFNHFVVDKNHSVDVCSLCVDRFLKWQGKNIAKMFPTPAMKRRFGKR